MRAHFPHLLRQHADLRWLVLGTFATQAGQWALTIGMGWLMLTLTDSAFQVGLLSFAGGLPMLLASLPAGLLLDRFDRRRLMMAGQTLIVTLALALTALVLADAATPTLLLLASFVNGTLMTLGNTARQTMAPATVPRAELPAAIGLTAAAVHASRVIGPSLVAAVVALTGIAGAFIAQALLVGIGAVLSLLLSPALAGRGHSKPLDGGLRQAFRWLRAAPVARDLVLLSAVPMLLVFPYLHLLPVFARDVLRMDSDGLALLMAVSGSGALVGGLLAARVAVSARPGRGMLLLVMAYGVLVSGFAHATTLAVALPLMVTASVCAALYMSLNATLLQLQVAESMRGRITGIQQLTYALFLVGALPMGALADVAGAPFAVTLGAMLSTAVTLAVALRAPHLWRLGGTSSSST